MKKIPVWRSLGFAYRFAFGNLATIIGLVWLPTMIVCVAGYFVISRYFDGVLTAIANGNRFAAYSGTGYYYLYRIGTLLFESVIAVSVMRQAFAPRRRSVFVHFALGPAEFRMFGAFVAATMIILTIEFLGAVLLLVGTVLLAAFAKEIGAAWGSTASWGVVLAFVVLATAFVGMILFVTIRLTFLLVPVTVAENKIDLIRSWELSRGNFWRAFWIMLFSSFPAWLLYLAVQIAFVGFATAAEGPNVSPVGNLLSQSLQAAALQVERVRNWLPYFYGAWFLVRPLAAGLTSGASAAAYRALVPEAPAVSTRPADMPLAASAG